MMPAIALATYADEPTLFHDEAPLVDYLTANDVAVYPTTWNSPEVTWSSYDLVVLRNTWDYHRQIQAFRGWLHCLEINNVPVVNPLPLLRWNIDKTYLSDLSAQGIATLPTIHAKNQQIDLAECLTTQGWSDAVVKPIISGSGDHTWVITSENAATSQKRFDWLNQQLGMMIQPVAPQIKAEGEYSLVFFGGVYSHTVRKVPAPDGFFVQEEYGGSIDVVELDETLIAQAAQSIAVAEKLTGITPVYARVDGLRDEDRFVLMELECVEPELYFSRVPHAAERLGNLILEAL